jgi:hypothetical protein
VSSSHPKADKYDLKEVLDKMQQLPSYQITSKVVSTNENTAIYYDLIKLNNWADLIEITKILKS